MVRSLWSAATGMNGQQLQIDTISNNLANVNTTGFKKKRAEFEDLVYQNLKLAGTPATEDTVTPVGIQMGNGVRLGATQRMFNQGSLQNTENISDVAIMGEGFSAFSNMTEAMPTPATARLKSIRPDSW